MSEPNAISQDVATKTQQVLGAGTWDSQMIMIMSGSILMFLLLVLVFSAILLWRSKANPDQVTKVVSIVVIIGASTVLLMVGYSNEQITPIIGLFGAIVGYVLGKDASNKPIDTSPKVAQVPIDDKPV